MTNLDDHQLAAVESAHMRTLVMAGAGSGKTRVLVERIAYLIEEKQVSPYEIVALTFTRKASSEMKTRLRLRIGNKARAITCGTSHGIAVDMIRKFNPAKTRHSVYGEAESQMVLKDVAEELGVFKKTWKVPKKIIDAVLMNYAVQGQLPMESDPARPIFTAFKRRCEQNQALTYDDLLVELHKMIPELAKYLNWRYILVDECQDLTPLQWGIINDISFNFKADIYAVGDLDQSIYSFRGAYPEYLLYDCSDYVRFILEPNYRSMPEIVAAGNNVIQNNVDRIKKTSVAFREYPVLGNPLSFIDGMERIFGEVQLHKNIDSASIVDMISGRINSRIPRGGIAVLARTHSLLQKISRLLDEKNIAHVYAGNKNSMLKELPAVTVHAFLRLLVNPMDNFSFMVIRKILCLSDLEYSELRYKATCLETSHFVSWMYLYTEDTPERRFFSCYDLLEALNFIFNMATGLTSSEPWVIDIKPIFAFIDNWLCDPSNNNPIIQIYLDYVATFDTQDELDKGEDEQPNVILSTIHAAKGLEFDTVIIAGMNEGIFPSARAESSVKDMEDERRLAYVAITRAKDRLIMTVRPEHTVDAKGNGHDNPISRFVREATNG